jgi:hypothetical protein
MICSLRRRWWWQQHLLSPVLLKIQRSAQAPDSCQIINEQASVESVPRHWLAIAIIACGDACLKRKK